MPIQTSHISIFSNGLHKFTKIDFRPWCISASRFGGFGAFHCWNAGEFACATTVGRRLRLQRMPGRDQAWWLEVVPFFDVHRQRIWVFWRRLLHTAHHRTQLSNVSASFGPACSPDPWSNGGRYLARS